MRIAALLLVLSTGCTGGHVARLNLGRTPPGVAVDAQVHYYDVTAATLAELRRGMRELGPRWEGRSWQAATQSTFRWTFQYERAGVHSCELRKVRVQVRTVVTFPRWNPTAEPDSAMLAWWHQLNAGLLEHERGHAQLSVTTAGAIARELEGMSGGNCAALATRASAIGSRHIDASRRKQVDYDRTTRHGATQIELAGRLSSP